MDPNPRAALERQQLRLRERQKFFEDILQPETEFVFPLSHLHLESHRPPIGSISSMEVNVDTLEQVELIDLGDQDGADVFLPWEDPPPTPRRLGWMTIPRSRVCHCPRQTGPHPALPPHPLTPPPTRTARIPVTAEQTHPWPSLTRRRMGETAGQSLEPAASSGPPLARLTALPLLHLRS